MRATDERPITLQDDESTTRLVNAFRWSEAMADDQDVAYDFARIRRYPIQ